METLISNMENLFDNSYSKIFKCHYTIMEMILSRQQKESMQKLLVSTGSWKKYYLQHVVKSVGHKVHKINEDSMDINKILYFKAQADLPQNEWRLGPEPFGYTNDFSSHSKQIFTCVHNSVFPLKEGCKNYTSFGPLNTWISSCTKDKKYIFSNVQKFQIPSHNAKHRTKQKSRNKPKLKFQLYIIINNSNEKKIYENRISTNTKWPTQYSQVKS